MKFMKIYTTCILLLLTFSFTNFAYNPFQNKNAVIFWDHNLGVISTEGTILELAIKEAFENRIDIIQEYQELPSWLNDYHMSYNSRNPQPFADQLKETATHVILIHYHRNVTYGLSGDREFSGYIDVGGMSPSSMSYGVPISINITDENPEWQHQTSVYIDIYEATTGKRVLTLIQNKESSSDTKNDPAAFKDNISDIAGVINKVLFKKSTWSKYAGLSVKPVSIRDVNLIKAKIADQVFHLFSIDTSIGNFTIDIAVKIHEYGTVKYSDDKIADNNISQKITGIVNDIQWGRVIKPNDSANIKIKFNFSTGFGKRLVNGYYFDINGDRDTSEVWRILHRYVSEIVKHSVLSSTMKQEKLHLKFAININGTIENIILNGTPNALVKKKNLLEDISEWNFGDKTGISAGTTNIELIFDFNKDKMSASK